MYVYHVNTIDIKRHVIGSHFLFFLEGRAGWRGEAPPPAWGAASPCLYAYNTKKCTYWFRTVFSKSKLCD